MHDLIKGLVLKNNSKIVLLVMDGLGGLPREDGKTELEAADTPILDGLARENACGLHLPVDIGITPGSGPGHLALFGYDPKVYQIGRGILEALGLGLHVEKTDIAIRCNYSTLKDDTVTDRRAGRIPTPESSGLTERLQEAIPSIDEAEVIFAPGMEHRFAVILRFPQELEQGSAALNDTDPQKEGKTPLPLESGTPQAEKVARVAEKLIARASEVLRGQERANHILLRGFSQRPEMPSFEEAYGLRAMAVSVYPMYRGVARLVGMDAPYLEGDIGEEIDFLRKNLEDYDFFFVHVKKVDSHGEDGNFDAKAGKIEEVDRALPGILEMDPDVLMVTGDHSTPATMGTHSWHPVPVLLRSRYVLGGLCEGFSERQCLRGELGIFPTKALMPLALANSGRLKKFGA